MMALFRAALAVTLSIFLVSSCVYKEIPIGPNCTGSDLTISIVLVTPATSCTAVDGQLEVAGVGGDAPYQYFINGGVPQSSTMFTSLSAGTYTVSVSDANGCTASVDITVSAANSTLAATSLSSPDTNCFEPHNGSITVLPTGGATPYEFRIDNGVFAAATNFANLASGSYKVTVKDGEGCMLTLNISVPRGDTGVSYASQIVPILNATCNFASCHGAGNGTRDFTNFANVFSKAAAIKVRTGNLSMPPAGSVDLTIQQLQLIACWVDDGAKNN